MKEEHMPYIIFLPSKHEDQIALLTSIFGSKVKMEILNEFCLKKRVYQKTLIERLSYSNKTVIKHLKDLVELNILNERMIKKEGRWLKIFGINEPMRWLVQLLRNPEDIPRDEMKKIITEFLNEYITGILKIAD
ncbi:MAG: hypothetical protein U9N35_01520, partial [Euryarchaeota archaeon]|nr:hypothetical protein [Euryarchaeota archaeon]